MVGKKNLVPRFSVDFSKLIETTDEYWIDFLHEQSRTPITASQNFAAQKRKSFLMLELLRNCWSDDEGQDIAEYAVMLAVILVIVVGTIRLVGGQANNVFSETASAIGG
jgi:Flp pilus assembly pilin Flp